MKELLVLEVAALDPFLGNAIGQPLFGSQHPTRAFPGQTRDKSAGTPLHIFSCQDFHALMMIASSSGSANASSWSDLLPSWFFVRVCRSETGRYSWWNGLSLIKESSREKDRGRLPCEPLETAL